MCNEVKEYLISKVEDIQKLSDMPRRDLVDLWNKNHSFSTIEDSEYCRMTMVWSALCELKIKIERYL